ncbi:hypothetical protein [Streptomyces phage phiScoe25]|nr:hypothetical protein [Streptomyces phage phiScoe25]
MPGSRPATSRFATESFAVASSTGGAFGPYFFSPLNLTVTV